ncbi:hypothetical protein [Nostoc sp.]|uniref:hypothetical protein n=1 Tax=Nostoc sp. TaxID=1180 RepID=UPI002FF47D18
MTTTITDKDTAAGINQLYAIAIDADAIARAILFERGYANAYAIEQPGDVDVNEIIIRPTRQEL